MRPDRRSLRQPRPAHGPGGAARQFRRNWRAGTRSLPAAAGERLIALVDEPEAGSSICYTKPKAVLRVLAKADKGKVYELGHNYDGDTPPVWGAQIYSAHPRLTNRSPVRLARPALRLRSTNRLERRISDRLSSLHPRRHRFPHRP